jgi:hypothetical protein
LTISAAGPLVYDGQPEEKGKVFVDQIRKYVVMIPLMAPEHIPKASTWRNVEIKQIDKDKNEKDDLKKLQVSKDKPKTSSQPGTKQLPQSQRQ